MNYSCSAGSCCTHTYTYAIVVGHVSRRVQMSFFWLLQFFRCHLFVMLLLLLLSVSVLENVKMLHTHSQQQFYNSISLLQRHKHTYTCKNIVLCTSASSCVCIIYLLYFFLLFACLIQISCIEIIENILFMLSAFSFTFPLCCRSH